MSEPSRLTPLSRGLITAAIVGGIFFLLKTFVLPKKDGTDGSSTDSTTVATGKESTAPLILKLAGSSTLGANMMPQIAKQFMTTELNAKNVAIQKVNDVETNVVGSIDGTEKRIHITIEGSAQGVMDMQSQKADLAMVSGGADFLAPDIQLANIALDGIAVVVNRANSLKELSKSQVRDIFMGKITNWSQVGGQAGVINCYARSLQSGTFEAFKQLVLEQATATLPVGVTVIEDSKKLVAAVEGDPNGIGFSSFSSIGVTNALGLSDAGTAVQYPSVFTIQTEDYLLTRRLYLASLRANNNPMTNRFVEFCKADDKGQKVVGDAGFVNMNLHNADTHTAIANAPPQYLDATKGAKRLPTTLHFQSGSKAPDTRATDDIKRIVTILSEPASRQKQVELIGFTDNVGNPTQNLSLSSQRAQSIQAELAKFGIKTEVFGFGQALPIATNVTPVGQNKNRRVEVWIK
jgi:phosphate transport system substrate-binding protein